MEDLPALHLTYESFVKWMRLQETQKLFQIKL